MAAHKPGSTAGYITDVAYGRQFCKELSPILLHAAAALNGVASSTQRDKGGDGAGLEEFDFCELGSAHGDTTATLAAAYPRARFVGVDLNPEHVAAARTLSTQGGLDNVRFLECDFEALPREELPDFDFIGAHGVLSWVAPEKMRSLIAFAAAKLKPRGLLYVSYNALPGWAAVAPLRRLMRDTSNAADGDTLARARRGLEAAQRLCDGGAEYFTGNPAAKEMLATMARMGLPYVAHEYFQEDWHPMYFADVVTEMEAFGLSFAGEVPLYRNVAELCIPASLEHAFRGIDDRRAFESLKDFATNQFFRGDVYVKGHAPRSESVTRAYLDTTRFGTTVSGPRIPREVWLGARALRFDGPLFDLLIRKLGESASTLAELARDPELAAFAHDAIRAAVLQLAFGEQATPMLPRTTAGARAPREPPRVALAYNRMILNRPLSAKMPVVLAAPVAGTGLPLPALHAVALRVLTEVAPGDRRTWFRAFVEKQSLNLSVRDQRIDDKDEQARILGVEVEQFRARETSKLVELGILEGAEEGV